MDRQKGVGIILDHDQTMFPNQSGQFLLPVFRHHNRCRVTAGRHDKHAVDIRLLTLIFQGVRQHAVLISGNRNQLDAQRFRNFDKVRIGVHVYRDSLSGFKQTQQRDGQSVLRSGYNAHLFDVRLHTKALHPIQRGRFLVRHSRRVIIIEKLLQITFLHHFFGGFGNKAVG
ncbi:hypothetical protein D1872_275320 [compost metagenome]